MRDKENLSLGKMKINASVNDISMKKRK